MFNTATAKVKGIIFFWGNRNTGGRLLSAAAVSGTQQRWERMTALVLDAEKYLLNLNLGCVGSGCDRGFAQVDRHGFECPHEVSITFGGGFPSVLWITGLDSR